jgi:uncharacterized Zn finger protein/superfamily II DNA or RNA helicase
MRRGRKSKFSSWYYDKPEKLPIEAGSGIRGGGKYGTTWWGQQWLQAFNQISDSNRLPRGRTYANNGSVRDIQIDQNRILAKVQGTRNYQVEIEIPAFSRAERERITQLVVANPDLLSRLLNRELPPELEELCRKQGTHIFPRSWHTFKASCSCPDWAMPCKHLAAIIYLVANEIDKNPFLVFALHAYDLLAELEKQGFAAGEAQSAQALPLSQLRRPLADTAGEAFHFDPALLEALDFSSLPDCRDGLLAILSPQPVFSPTADFREVLKKALTAIAKDAAKADPLEAGSLQSAAPDEAVYRIAEIIELRLDEAGSQVELLAWDADENLLFESQSFPEWEQWLTGVPAGRLAQLPDELRALWLAWRLAYALARQSAIVPQLLQHGTQGYSIRWLPALLREEVAEAFRSFEKLLPPAIIHIKAAEGSLTSTKEDYPLALLSIFLNQLVQTQVRFDAASMKAPLYQLFFAGQAVVFDKFETREYPAAIALWLNRFFLAEKDLVPLLEVEEASEGSFEVKLALEDKTAPLALPVPLAEVFTQRKWAARRIELLRDLSLLGDFFPALRQVLASKGQQPLVYAAENFADILLQTLPLIRLFGIRVLLPKSLSRLLRPQLSLRMSSTGESGRVLTKSGINLAQMLDYRWQVAIGEHDLSAQEFLELLQNSRGLVKLHGEYVYFDEQQTRALAEKLAKPPVLSGPELLQVALSEEHEGVRITLSAELRALMQQLLEAEQMPLPQGLQAELRPYQHRGYSWLCKNARLGFGSILADDMGLGKTLQALATLLYFKERGELNADNRALAIVPTTLLTNWEREAARFAPALKTFIYHGPNRSLAAAKDADLVLTSYGLARTDQAKLSKEKWLALIIDEAQQIKNPAAGQAKAVKKIAAPVRIALSGTPVENRLSEYWSIFDFANQGYLGGLKKFKDAFAIPIEAERDRRALRRFHKVTQPFVLRRLKTDRSIINDLPDKVEADQFCSLAPEQATLYQAVVEQSLQQIEQSEGIQRRGMVLNLIMALKQICNHPAQYLKKGIPDPSQSGKCPVLLDLLERAFDNDEKVLLFTQFREMGELLLPMIQQRFGLEADFLHGGVSRKQRDTMVENFQTKRSHRLLLLSLKAGGTGLNLTAASQVIHFDLWWNPAVEAQATDRAFRIGQQRNVLVHRFITAATFEERINAMIQRKKELADLTVASGETWIGELSDRELRQLFTLHS